MAEAKVYNETEHKMRSSLEALQRELAGIRTGRAAPHLLDGITVEAYGQLMPLNQLATINVPDSRMLIVQPWDLNNLAVIERAILKANIGVTPANDGKIIRCPIPPLTEERRKELAKFVHRFGEDAKVALRNIRHHANDITKKMRKDGELGEDEEHRNLDRIQELTDQYVERIDKICEEKEKELMEG